MALIEDNKDEKPTERSGQDGQSNLEKRTNASGMKREVTQQTLMSEVMDRT